jgi:hypothetical protein
MWHILIDSAAILINNDFLYSKRRCLWHLYNLGLDTSFTLGPICRSTWGQIDAISLFFECQHKMHQTSWACTAALCPLHTIWDCTVLGPLSASGRVNCPQPQKRLHKKRLDLFFIAGARTFCRMDPWGKSDAVVTSPKCKQYLIRMT